MQTKIKRLECKKSLIDEIKTNRRFLIKEKNNAINLKDRRAKYTYDFFSYFYTISLSKREKAEGKEQKVFSAKKHRKKLGLKRLYQIESSFFIFFSKNFTGHKDQKL